ncbi:hypothetical protein [Prosthecomicrobium hirschii]|uniref:hypothetical protein n=1 Tax=Prosthecodimorpha hirschii TaxID=665126 RepID=UPI00128EEA0A|nr:hypothetical protein [Prosthecomicrobium hirschii]
MADVALQIEREIATLDAIAFFSALPPEILDVDRTAEADHRDAIGDHLTDWRRMAGDLLVAAGGADAR